MAVTQTIEFPACPGLAAGAAVKLFSPGSDTAVATATGVAEGANAKGRYSATFTDAPAGTYAIVATDSTGAAFAVDAVTLTLTTATFQTAGLTVPGTGSGGGGSGSDPWTAPLGSYAPNTAGDAQQRLLAGMVRAVFNVISPVLTGGRINIQQGDDYKVANSRAINFPLPVAQYGNLTGATVSFVARHPVGQQIGPIAGTITAPNTANQAATVEIVKASTAAAIPSDDAADAYAYACKVTTGAGDVTTFTGPLILARDLFA